MSSRSRRRRKRKHKIPSTSKHDKQPLKSPSEIINYISNNESLLLLYTKDIDVGIKTINDDINDSDNTTEIALDELCDDNIETVIYLVIKVKYLLNNEEKKIILYDKRSDIDRILCSGNTKPQQLWTEIRKKYIDKKRIKQSQPKQLKPSPKHENNKKIQKKESNKSKPYYHNPMKREIGQYIRDEVITNGYIRECEKLLTPNYIISMSIYSIIIKFIMFKKPGGFNKHCYDPNTDRLKFISNTTIKAVAHSDYRQYEDYMTCFYEEEISDKICNEFKLSVKWIHCVSSFFVGYITISTEKYLDNLYKNKDGDGRAGNYFLGNWENKGYSVGFSIIAGNKYLNIYNEMEGIESIDGNKEANTMFGEGDVFEFIFNFGDNVLHIYCNGNKLYSKWLNVYQFTPTFVFLDNEEINISSQYK